MMEVSLILVHATGAKEDTSFFIPKAMRSSEWQHSLSPHRSIKKHSSANKNSVYESLYWPYSLLWDKPMIKIFQESFEKFQSIEKPLSAENQNRLTLNLSDW